MPKKETDGHLVFGRSPREDSMAMATGLVASARASESTRWVNLIFCIICMVMIANLQYGWTLFVNPINKAHGWSIASIQVAFAVFIALETWLTPIEGWIVDMLGPSRGPKIVVSIGGILVAIGWVLNAYRSEEHTSELQSRQYLVCRLLLEKK